MVGIMRYMNMRHSVSHMEEVILCSQNMEIEESQSLGESPSLLQGMLRMAAQGLHCTTQGHCVILGKLDLPNKNSAPCVILARVDHKRNLCKIWKEQPLYLKFTVGQGAPLQLVHIVTDLVAHLVGMSSSQATAPPVPSDSPPSASPRPGLGASTARCINSQVVTGTSSSHVLPTSLRWGAVRHRPGFQFVLKGSSLFLCDPCFPWASSLSLASPTIYNSFLALPALVTYSDFYPTEKQRQRLSIDSLSALTIMYGLISIINPLFHIPLSGSASLSNPY